MTIKCFQLKELIGPKCNHPHRSSLHHQRNSRTVKLCFKTTLLRGYVEAKLIPGRVSVWCIGWEWEKIKRNHLKEVARNMAQLFRFTGIYPFRPLIISQASDIPPRWFYSLGQAVSRQIWSVFHGKRTPLSPKYSDKSKTPRGIGSHRHVETNTDEVCKKNFCFLPVFTFVHTHTLNMCTKRCALVVCFEVPVVCLPSSINVGFPTLPWSISRPIRAPPTNAGRQSPPLHGAFVEPTTQTTGVLSLWKPSQGQRERERSVVSLERSTE